MTERELREALRRAGGEDPDARDRAWDVVRTAYRQRAPVRRRALWAPAALAAAVLAAGGAGVAAAAAPHSGVGGFVRDVLGVTRPAPGRVGRLPGGGRLLAQAGDSAWLVASDGSRRRLGRYAGAAWSPHGRFVLAWRGGTLSALQPNGDVRWSLTRPRPVSAARWGPVDGFRVAYLAGPELRIVDGDGTGDRALAAALPTVAPAWRPRSSRLLAFVDPASRVRLVHVDTGRLLWRTARLDAPSALAWSPGGERLLVVTRDRLLVLDAAGRRVTVRGVPAGTAAQDPVWSPDGAHVALVRRGAAARSSQMLLLDPAHGLHATVLFAGPGPFGTPAWSPDGRRLLVPWPAADQWLYLRPGGTRLNAVARIAEQFTPGSSGPAFAGVVSWCCSERRPRRARP